MESCRVGIQERMVMEGCRLGTQERMVMESCSLEILERMVMENCSLGIRESNLGSCRLEIQARLAIPSALLPSWSLGCLSSSPHPLSSESP